MTKRSKYIESLELFINKAQIIVITNNKYNCALFEQEIKHNFKYDLCATMTCSKCPFSIQTAISPESSLL